ncbi:MAG: hypothetical protein K0S53_893 [Bacteroidetes bacterium]|jgi:osmotically-inducible protein OsmY|nr:hypothetical protein [Bacteroidota bacterium]
MKTGIENQNDGTAGFNWDSKNYDLNKSNRISSQHYFNKMDSEKFEQQSSIKDDIDLKKSVMNIIKWNSSIDETKIRIKVKNGWVTLDGVVDLDFKRLKAGLLARDINGVTGVTNLITVSNNSSGTA